MNRASGAQVIRQYLSGIDWKLLVFLVLILNVKLVVKLLAIIIVYAIQPDFKFGFKSKNSRLPLLYLLLPIIAISNLLLYQGFDEKNLVFATGVGIAFWLVSILVIHQVKLFIEKNDVQTIYMTLMAFFILNFAFSMIDLFLIILETGKLNPYQYQGAFQKYFINTGDYIKGVTFDTSTTNAAINAFGIVFFFFRRNFTMVFVCMFTLLLTASNLANLILFIVIVLLFIAYADRNQKSILIACMFLMVIFLGRIAPQNFRYIQESFERYALKKDITPHQNTITPSIREIPDSLLSISRLKEKKALLYLDSVHLLQKNKIASQPVMHALAVQKPEIPRDDIHSATFQNKDDTSKLKLELLEFMKEKEINTEKKTSQVPGKLLAFQQTALFFKDQPLKSLTGAGTGRFSSKLAFRATGLNIAGGYPLGMVFIDPAFQQNHLALYLQYFGDHEGLHSIIHTPNSAYLQLLGEYGLAGLLAFVFFYLGFFLKKRKSLSYGIPLMVLLLGFFFFEYWFEQLSLVILFELLLFLDIKEHLINSNGNQD